MNIQERMKYNIFKQILFISCSLIGSSAIAIAQTLQKPSNARLRGMAEMRERERRSYNDRSAPNALTLRAYRAA
jgi:hypothetical protein